MPPWIKEFWLEMITEFSLFQRLATTSMECAKNNKQRISERSPGKRLKAILRLSRLYCLLCEGTILWRLTSFKNREVRYCLSDWSLFSFCVKVPWGSGCESFGKLILEVVRCYPSFLQKVNWIKIDDVETFITIKVKFTYKISAISKHTPGGLIGGSENTRLEPIYTELCFNLLQDTQVAHCNLSGEYS